jgi:hypothetical protein
MGAPVRIFVLAAIAACSRVPHSSTCDGSCATGLDGRTDSGPRQDTVYTGNCLGSSGLYSDCDAQPNPDPNAGVFPGSTTIDGTTCPKVITQTSGIQLCVLEFSKISIAAGAHVRLAGRYPIVLVSTSTIAIDGILDASASLDVVNGGAGPGVGTGCTNTGGYGNDSPKGASGGGGGSFQGMGAAGGNSGSQIGGAPVAPMPLTEIRSGCFGGSGGNESASSGGRGGPPGGAVYLIAADSIALGPSSLIDASGGGGDPGYSKLAGAGGGGSGGMIGLAAPIITAQSGARLFAVGGGGGGGAGDSTSTAPTKGADGYGLGTSGASGGIGGEGIGGNGGQGSLAGMLDGAIGHDGVSAGANTFGGGGGGGGASGWIKLSPMPASFAGTAVPPAS